jgi:imidazole glycerol-phosphate synthase subunit HisH
MITLINYGSGNIQAIINIYKLLNIPIKVAQTAQELAGAEKIILPGVGSFDWSISRLESSGMRSSLDNLVLNNGCPILGICVGMQMMANRSEEGILPGLGWFDAEVRHFNETDVHQKFNCPHMGWNDVLLIEKDTLFKKLDFPRFYFLHSYYFTIEDSTQVLSTTNYHGDFISAVKNGKIFGVQFHPEKSHRWGVQLLQNFAEL